MELVTTYISWFSNIFVLTIGLFILFLIITFFFDITQRKDAILRNYPVIGHFRYIFSNLGDFFRQYFFAMDREEMPFNRAERAWVKRSSSDKSNTVAFGSTKNISSTGSIIFANCAFPTLNADAVNTREITIGKDYTPIPYTAHSIFNISGMSYGAISKPAVRALSKGAQIANCWMNTGEGGLSKYHLESGCDLVFQIGTAKYGIRTPEGTLDEQKLKDIAALPQVKMFEIKLSQGAKPGKGGILPAAKITPEIAQIRGIPENQDSISPNRHPEINSIAELITYIQHIKSLTGKPVGFKVVIGAYGWLEKLCQYIKTHGIQYAPDFITIDSGDGGTGAAPMPLIDNVGMSIKESLPLVVDIIKKYELHERIIVITSGKLVTPADVAWALATGAHFVTSARGFMFALGCIQSLKCNKNTCPTGITTHNKRLQKGLDPELKSIKVANYVRHMHTSVEMIAHSCGVKEPRELERFHVRIMQHNGKSKNMAELYPNTI